MQDHDDSFRSSDNLSGLKRCCLCLIEYISRQATDPHLYFQNKLAADTTAAKTVTDVLVILDYLLDWIEGANVELSGIARLDTSLNGQGLPSYTLMKSSREPSLGRILASGKILTEEDYCLVKQSIREPAGISDADRSIGGRLAMDYESRK